MNGRVYHVFLAQLDGRTYQTAIRLMLMGLLPMNLLLQEEPPHEE